MVYESDFYTTRRPYRTSPSYSSYTTSFEPSRQVRILPGLGKVHIVHSYDRLVPYVGHKRLTVVSGSPRVYSTRPSVLHREYDWIERKVRPAVGYSATNRYLNSNSAVRIYYTSYPIGSSYYSTISLPSSSYYPKIYRWYYDWPRTYSAYYPSSLYNYWPTRYNSYLPSSYYSYYWPYYRSYLSSFFRNCYLSNSPSLYYKSLDYEFNELENKIDNLTRMICITPLRGIDYLYYPETTRYYRPLTLYYNYYWPLRSLNYYSDVWPYYPYYRYLYYKYTLPSDRYYHLKSRIIYLPNSISGLTYRMYPTASYLRNKTYNRIGLYCDYYEPTRSLYWNSSYWPLYRSVNHLPSQNGLRLQKIFDDETRLIRAETSSLLRRIHDPVPRVRLNWPSSTISRYSNDRLPARYSSDNYIHKMLTTSPINQKVQYTTYYTEPVRKYIGRGGLSCLSYAGERAYNRRPYIYLYENPLQSDIQLLSYYINKFKQEKAASGVESSKLPLSPARPSRKFGAKASGKEDSEAAEEMRKLREARAARLAFINEEERETRIQPSSYDVDEALKAKKEKEGARLAEEKAIAEEQSRQEALAKEAARKAELARQEELAAKAAAERTAELEKQAAQTRKEEKKRQAEIDRIKREEEERQRREEQQKIEDESKAENERRQLERLEELARQAEADKEAELVRQADELAELARQEAELAEQEKQLAQEKERKRQEAELEELARQEAELEELERQERELEEQAKTEAEAAEKAKEDAEAARIAAQQAELEAQQAELEELQRQQAELDAMEAAMESDLGPPQQTQEIEAQETESRTQIDEAEDATCRKEEEFARAQAELEELERAQAELDALEAEAKEMESDLVLSPAELAKQKEAEEWERARAELEELERAQAELDALEAEAKEMESDLGPSSAEQNGDYDDDNAIAEDVPGQQSDEGEDAE